MMNEKKLVRVQYAVYDSKEDALADGWPDAEFGCWQLTPSSPKLVSGWIALEYDEPDDNTEIGMMTHQRIHPGMALKIDQTVIDYITGTGCTRANPALYVDADGHITVESQLFPHDDQLMLTDLERNNWLGDPELSAADLVRMIRDAIRDAVEALD